MVSYAIYSNDKERPESTTINDKLYVVGNREYSLGQNLLQLAQSGNTQQIEQIVRNLAAQKGVDFDSEFNAFKQSLGL